jgi:hypothetical protein
MKKPPTKPHMDENGTEAANNGKDADKASNHFQKVCNLDDTAVNFSALDSIEQRDAVTELERKPEMEELISLVKAMRGKARHRASQEWLEGASSTARWKHWNQCLRCLPSFGEGNKTIHSGKSPCSASHTKEKGSKAI